MKTLKLIFASLFRNDAAMEGRFQKWYLAAILFLLSIIISAVPLFVSATNTNGADFMDSTLYSFDVGIQNFSEALVDEDVDLIVEQDGDLHQLVNPNSSWETAFPLFDREGGIDFHYYEYRNHANELKLKVYYQGAASNDDALAFLNAKLEATNSAETPNLNIGSFVFFGQYSLNVFLYNPAGVAAGTVAGRDYASAMQGDYLSFAVGKNIKHLGTIDQFGNPIDRPTPTSTGLEFAEYQEKLLKNWEIFLDEAYSNIKVRNVWFTTGTILAINSILGVFMGLLVFVMTRGKTNPNRTMTFLEAYKITGWLLLSPAIISLIVGFIFPNYASMAFVLLVGLRMMWLSSKTLRPPMDPVKVAPKK
jgi:hypothetical protein